jgi:hypothetical protein
MPDKKQIFAFMGIVAAVVVGGIVLNKWVMPMMNANKVVPPAAVQQ